MKKGGFLRNVFDGLRSNQPSAQSGQGYSSGSGQNRGAPFDQYEGLLKPNNFSLSTVVRHGFPAQPTAIAFDPVQRILAIGTKSGAIRIFGRPFVDAHGQHKPEYAVLHIKFIVNQGAVITVTADDSIHLWSLRGPNLVLQLSSTSTNSSPLPPLGSNHQAGSGTNPTGSGAGGVSGGVGGSGGGVGGVSSYTSMTTNATAQSSSTLSNTDSACVSGTGTGGSGVGGVRNQTNTNNSISKLPQILHTLKFQREHITFVHLTLQSKWLYIGTERGNVHIMNVETFELSGYVINWNKAIELSRKTHPGSIIHISECPQDTNKLLIGYESGYIVLWDLKTRAAEGRYYNLDNLLWLCWHYEGKQFMAAHGDGSLITWHTRSNAQPAHKTHPHAKMASGSGGSTGDDSMSHQQTPSMSFRNELYRSINKVDWKTTKNSEQFILFSGGLPYDNPNTTGATPSPQPGNQVPSASPSSSGNQQLAPMAAGGSSLSPSSPSPSPTSITQSPSRNLSSASSSQQQHQHQPASYHDKNLHSTSLTVMYCRSITVLEMDELIVDFITMCDNSPYENDASEPYAVIVLLVNDLILIDLNSPGYPSFQSPYPMNIHESPVTSIHYLADCPSDLIPSLYSTSNSSVMTGQQRNRKGFSDKEWPIDGGEWGQSLQSYPELVITGHADGTIKFWDMSGVNFDSITKIKTSKLFEKPIRLPTNSPNLLISGGGMAATRNSPSPFGSKSPIEHQQQQQQALSGSQSGQIDSLASAGQPGADVTPASSSTSGFSSTSTINQLGQSFNGTNNNDDYYAIEQIEFCPSSKHLLVAGACSQVIQFKLNRKETQSELTTVIVEPTSSSNSEPVTGFGVSSLLPNQYNMQNSNHKQHFILRPKSGHHRRSPGFQPELVCLTPWIIATNCGGGASSDTQQQQQQMTTYCQAPYRITSLALHTAHNLLAYSHDNGIVIIDIIQKCVVINASTNELHGPAHLGSINRDIISAAAASAASAVAKASSTATAQLLGKSPSKRMSAASTNILDTANNVPLSSSQDNHHSQLESQRKSPPTDQHESDRHPRQQHCDLAKRHSEPFKTHNDQIEAHSEYGQNGGQQGEGPVAPPRLKRRSVQIACGEELIAQMRPLSPPLSNIEESVVSASGANDTDGSTGAKQGSLAVKLGSKLNWSVGDQQSLDVAYHGTSTSESNNIAPTDVCQDKILERRRRRDRDDGKWRRASASNISGRRPCDDIELASGDDDELRPDRATGAILTSVETNRKFPLSASPSCPPIGQSSASEIEATVEAALIVASQGPAHSASNTNQIMRTSTLGKEFHANDNSSGIGLEPLPAEGSKNDNNMKQREHQHQHHHHQQQQKHQQQQQQIIMTMTSCGRSTGSGSGADGAEVELAQDNNGARPATIPTPSTRNKKHDERGAEHHVEAKPAMVTMADPIQDGSGQVRDELASGAAEQPILKSSASSLHGQGPSRPTSTSGSCSNSATGPSQPLAAPSLSSSARGGTIGNLYSSLLAKFLGE